MKNLKYVFSICLVLLISISCVQDDDNTDFVNNIAAPTNVSALFTVTQDNTGLVTISPLGEGVSNFKVNFGDSSGVSDFIDPGNNVQHIYEEGSYEVTITAFGLNGLTTSVNQSLVVSFQAPQNLEVIIENDAAISKQVNVTATAEFAISYEVDFGDPANTVLMANNGESVSFIYDDPGTYTISITSFSAAIETTQYTEEFEVTAIVQPLASAPTPPSRSDSDVISIFSSAYTDVPDTNYFPDWGQASQGSGWALFDLAGDEMLQYINLSYQGIALADGTSVDVSGMEYIHLDVWTADAVTQIETSLINGPSGSTEAPVTVGLTANDWTSIDIPISDYTDQGLSVNEIFQLKFVGEPWAAGTVFIDNIYFYKAPTGASPLVGTWRIAPEDAALSVGPGDGSLWWFLNQFDDDVALRSCFMDDEFVFNADGSFQNVLGSETWLEPWQGVDPEACGAPIAPHDGSNAATYTDNGSALTLNGLGAYLGLAKVHNTGEDGAPVGNTITYDYVLSNNNNTLEVTISGFNGGAEVWYFKLIKDAPQTSPLVGTWKIAPEDAALSVGPGDGSLWWFLNQFDDDVAIRSCFMDDEYIFNADGSFQNVLGAETWLEPWQGVDPEACGSPIAPHDGTNAATFTNNGSTVTLNGLGAYLGLAKVHNTGENGVPVGDTITYDYVLSDNDNTLEVTISGFNGGAEVWYFKLLKQ